MKASQRDKWKQLLRLGSDIVRCPFYRLTVNGQCKAADLTSLLMLHSVATAFKSLLRPSDLSSHDKGPAESLAGNYRFIILTAVGKYLGKVLPRTGHEGPEGE